MNPRNMSEEEEIELLTSGIETDGAKARIRALVKRLHRAEAERDEANDAWSKKHEETTANHAKAIAEREAAVRAEANEDVALAGLGLTDPTGRRLTREKWATLDPKARPATPAEYHRQILEAAKKHAEDPKAHKAPEVEPWQRGYLSIPETVRPPAIPSLGGNSGPPADWTPERIKTTLGFTDPKKP
jgi:hypothetical protein